MTSFLNITAAHPSWHNCIRSGLQRVDPSYLAHLQKTQDWLPGPDNIFRAFSLPLQNVHYILFGESPYPRAISANGYAFWDAAVDTIWSETGLHKSVNRATSLRNFIKMLLIAEGLIKPQNLSQSAIASIDKRSLIATSSELFHNMLSHGFLLLNTTLVLQKGNVKEDAKAWRPFIQEVLNFIGNHRPHTEMILLGKVAATLNEATKSFSRLIAEHPYNLSFITNPNILNFFRPLFLLRPSLVQSSQKAAIERRIRHAHTSRRR